MNICSNCGKGVSEEALHCGHCGHKLEVGQNKTMMGLGAIQGEWREKIEQAYKESQAEADGQDDEELETAPTQMMAAVEGPATQQTPAQPQAAEDDLGLAATAMLDTVNPPAAAPEEPAPAPVAAPAATSDAGLQLSAGSEDEEEWQIGKLDSKVEADLAGDTFPPPVADARPEPTGQAVLGAGDLPGGDDFGTGDGEGKSRKRLMIILGAIFGIFFFCCASSVVAGFFFNDALQDMIADLEAQIEP